LRHHNRFAKSVSPTSQTLRLRRVGYPEMLLPVWLRLMGALGTGAFNFKIVR
jgi:hypothetical protein